MHGFGQHAGRQQQAGSNKQAGREQGVLHSKLAASVPTQACGRSTHALTHSGGASSASLLAPEPRPPPRPAPLPRPPKRPRPPQRSRPPPGCGRGEGAPWGGVPWLPAAGEASPPSSHASPSSAAAAAAAASAAAAAAASGMWPPTRPAARCRLRGRWSACPEGAPGIHQAEVLLAPVPVPCCWRCHARMGMARAAPAGHTGSGACGTGSGRHAPVQVACQPSTPVADRQAALRGTASPPPPPPTIHPQHPAQPASPCWAAHTAAHSTGAQAAAAPAGPPAARSRSPAARLLAGRRHGLGQEGTRTEP